MVAAGVPLSRRTTKERTGPAAAAARWRVTGPPRSSPPGSSANGCAPSWACARPRPTRAVHAQARGRRVGGRSDPACSDAPPSSRRWPRPGRRRPTAPDRSSCCPARRASARPAWSASWLRRVERAGGRTAWRVGYRRRRRRPRSPPGWSWPGPGRHRPRRSPHRRPGRLELNRLSARPGRAARPPGPPARRDGAGAGAAARLRVGAAAGRVVLRRPAHADRARRRAPGRPGEPAADRARRSPARPAAAAARAHPARRPCRARARRACWPTSPGAACPSPRSSWRPIDDRTVAALAASLHRLDDDARRPGRRGRRGQPAAGGRVDPSAVAGG